MVGWSFREITISKYQYENVLMIIANDSIVTVVQVQ